MTKAGRTRAPSGVFRRLSKAEEGFSIIEVMVAFTLLAIVTLGVVPLFVSALRGVLVSKLDTGGKNLSQERLEQMRNVLFHVGVNAPPAKPSVCWTDVNKTDPEAGAVDCDYRDMIDTYFRSLTAAASVTSGGYVAPGAPRSSDEPAGAFYRFVVNPVPGFPRYSQVTATQFLDVNRNPVTPVDTYNSQVAGSDFPTTRLVGVTVVTTWTAGNLTKKFVAFTQIAEGRPAAPAVTMQARATGIRIVGGLPAPIPGTPAPLLSMEAGISSADGSLSTGASAAVSVTGSFAQIAPGVRVEGKSAGATAPPNSSAVDGDKFPYSLIDGAGESSPSCGTFDCLAFGVGDQTRNVKASIVSGQPTIASLSAPAVGRVRFVSSPGGLNLGYRNRPEAASMPGLDISQMLVRVNEGGSSIPTSQGATYLASIGGSGHKAEAGVSARTQSVKMVPTTFAPDGIVQITLFSSSLVCTTTGSSSSATADFDAEVRYLQYNPGTNLNEYVTVDVEDGDPSPLTAALLTSTQITTTPGGPATLVPLETYIDSWGSLTGANTTITSPPKTVSSNLNGIVAITTRPTRVGDPDSAVAVQVGVLTCVAEDNR